ncbi:hypothetical protein GA0070616_4387 [Micromonospora nigra]|uniref:Uncharacterized protein n=1 Tax=Micromonospora nigra TaxID=145857 RepID=A0A1C6SRX4_9ACTN|nr:hypothetical protein GA0070616_4387 [Micromonospora nigra]
MTDPWVRRHVLLYAWPHVIRRLRTRPLRARLLADLLRKANRR